MAEDSVQPVSIPQVESHGRLMDTVERKAQTKKNIEMGVLAALCLMIIGFLIFRGNSAGKAPDSTTISTANVHSSVEVGQKPESAQPLESIPGFNLASQPNRRDPFAPLVVAREKGSEPVHTRSIHRDLGIPPMPPMGSIRIEPSLPPALPNVEPAKPVAEADPAAELAVTGILCGNPSVAIIRDKSSGRHYVRVGDKIGERLTVLSIEKGRVLLQAGGKNVVLTLGGNKDASKS